MFERFTDRARNVMALANQEAQRSGHGSLDTGHILLGLIREGSGVGANVLRALGVDLQAARMEVEQLVMEGSYPAAGGKFPQAPGAKAAIVYAIEETRRLGHNYVGTEHILLGILRDQDGLPARVLTSRGVTVDDARQQLLAMLNEQGSAPCVAGDLPSDYLVWSHTYREGEKIRIGAMVEVTVGRSRDGTVTLSIQAPPGWLIQRRAE